MKLVEVFLSQLWVPCFSPQISHECRNMHGGLEQGVPCAYLQQYFLLGGSLFELLLLLVVNGWGRKFDDAVFQGGLDAAPGG